MENQTLNVDTKELLIEDHKIVGGGTSQFELVGEATIEFKSISTRFR